MRSIAVIEDSTIFSMLNDPAFNTTIPCFFGKKDIFRNSASGCGTCTQKKQNRRREELARIKACLAGMSTEKKAEFKALCNAEKVRLVYYNNANQIVQMDF